MKQALRWFAMAAALSVLAGCNTAPKRDPAFAAARPVMPLPEPQGTGAIYHSGQGITWFEDIRARRVGDLLTIKLVEKTDASKKASTSAARDATTEIDNPTLFGTTPRFDLPSWFPLDSTNDNNLRFNLSGESDFEGEGESSQSNKLTGDVTVTVTEVLPNGYLVVKGEKRIGINQGNEYIKLSGIVRPYDLDSSNTVSSTKVGDVTIVYVGDGAVAESNTAGWLSRFFISALFPF